MAYPFSEIEGKWQRTWQEQKLYRVTRDTSRQKYYVMDMFAYPSGAGLHMGHVHYTAADIVMRYKHMRGFNVLHPTGWDAFGLPAEQYAVRNKLHPRITTERNIAAFRKQLESLGFGYDWSREVNTTDPDYFKWTQWIFLKIYNSYFDPKARAARPISELIAHLEAHGTEGLALPHGAWSVTASEWKAATQKGKADLLSHFRLAYLHEAPVNWCPDLGTVLANEEVAEQEEKGFKVVRRNMRQWMLRITAYAERLLDGLNGLDWPASTVEMQRNWIGRSVGAEIDFPIDGHAGRSIRVFTTRPDTLFGATYMVLAPEHPLVREITAKDQRETIQRYIDEVGHKSDLDRLSQDRAKTGAFTGAYAQNPASGELIPIYIADYVLMGYGTGAIMAVPGHDERDHQFAQAHGLPIQIVVHPVGAAPDAVVEAPFTEAGLAVHSGLLDGLATDEAKARMIEHIEAHGFGSRSIKYKLRDWLFSRQRYWGEPFPIIYVNDGDGEYAKALPESALPVTLPEVESYAPSGTGESPLATIPQWVQTKDPETGRDARRETNTMPQWAGSSWYYLRYLDPKNADALVSREDEQYWMNVDLYIGGTEHAVTHLLYSRFWHKILFDLGVVSTDEPFQRMFHQGIVLGENGVKMSKSLGNVVNPDDFLKEYGADTVRTYYMFLGPFEAMKPWDSKGIVGVYRFLSRVWRLVAQDDGTPDLSRLAPAGTPMSRELERTLHQTIHKVSEDLEALRFNTAVSALMILLNAMEDEARTGLAREAVLTLVQLLSPFAPHLADEMWSRLGQSGSVYGSPWPQYDASKAIEETVTLIFQVNGKLRDKLEVPRGLSKEQLEEFARQSQNVARHIEGKEIRKMIVVPDKLVNVVVG